MGQTAGKATRTAGNGPEVLKIDPITEKEWRELFAKRQEIVVPKGWMTKHQIMQLGGFSLNTFTKAMRRWKADGSVISQAIRCPKGRCRIYRRVKGKTHEATRPNHTH